MDVYEALDELGITPDRFRRIASRTAVRPTPSLMPSKPLAVRSVHGATHVAPNRKEVIMARKDEFDTAGGYVAIKDLLGDLVLFTPSEYVEEVKTDFGDKDAVMTDLVVLTAEGGPAEYTDVMIFQGSLIGALKRKIPTGRMLLGVIAKGEAKKGQNAPYILTSPDEAQTQMARDYLAG
ncbi:MAG: hypothetical protein ACRED4_01725, partial [Brevundimonas sp.]